MCNTSDDRADDGFDPTRANEAAPTADDKMALDLVGAMALLMICDTDRIVLIRLTRHGRTEYVRGLGVMTTTDSVTMARPYPETMARAEIEGSWRTDPKNPLANVTEIEYIDAPQTDVARVKRVTSFATKLSADLVRQSQPELAGCGGCNTGCTGKCSG